MRDQQTDITREIDSDGMIRESRNRMQNLFPEYNPVTGAGSTIQRSLIEFDGKSWHLPDTIYRDEPFIAELQREKSLKTVISKYQLDGDRASEAILEARFRHDFEFWAVTCVKVQDKKTKKMVPFVLRAAQRKLLAVLERMRINGVPIRVILLKARQWGGSTLIQVYMAWIQTFHRVNWHSAIVADDQSQARNIRSMYTKIARHYPNDIGSITFQPYEGSSNVREIVERGCIVGVGSVKSPNSLRSYDYAMLHLSEVGIWGETPAQSAEDLIQALRGTVGFDPYTMIVMESTAKGVGNLFHREWLEAEKSGGYTPVFVGWWEIEMYREEITDYREFFSGWTPYHWFLWDLGATLEGINWYFKHMRRENYSEWRMKEEFPSTAEEAFQSSGQRFFPFQYVQNVRQDVTKPIAIGDLIGDDVKGPDALRNIRFVENPQGPLQIWSMPGEPKGDHPVGNRYGGFADIGGTTEKADWSVLSIFDRFWMLEGGLPERACTYRNHLDQDLFAWKAAQISAWYHNAILSVEINSLNRKEDESITILDEIKDHYFYLFARNATNDREKLDEGAPLKYGFHMNVATKKMIYNRLVAAARDYEYIERDTRTCDEMDYFETKEDGSLGAKDGMKDDIVDTTAGGIWLVLNYMDPPYYDTEKDHYKPIRYTEAML